MRTNATHWVHIPHTPWLILRSPTPTAHLHVRSARNGYAYYYYYNYLNQPAAAEAPRRGGPGHDPWNRWHRTPSSVAPASYRAVQEESCHRKYNRFRSRWNSDCDCLCVRIYTYVCIYTWVWMYMYISYVCTYTHISLSLSLFFPLSLSLFLSLSVCVCAWVQSQKPAIKCVHFYISRYVCVCARVYIYIHIMYIFLALVHKNHCVFSPSQKTSQTIDSGMGIQHFRAILRIHRQVARVGDFHSWNCACE